MKKILAVMMTLVMLFSACAFAENENAELVISDVVVLAGEMPMLDLTGLGLKIGAVAEPLGMQLALSAAGQEAVALNLSVAEDKLLLSMTGVTGVYSIDTAVIGQAIEDAGVDMDVEAITNLDMNEVTAQISAEDQLALMALAMEAVAVAQAGTTAGGTETIDGVAYEVTKVEITAEQIKPLMDKAVDILDNYPELLAEAGIEDIAQAYAGIAPALSVSGTILDGEETSVIDFTVNGALYSGTEEEIGGYVNLYLEGKETGEDAVSMYLKATAGAGEESYALAFNLDASTENDGAWIPAAEGAIDLLAALEDEAQSQQLMLQAMSTGMTALSQMAAANETVAALMGSLMAG